jgi:hypothetical protein
MSDLALWIPIAAITAGPAGWVINNWVRAKHGYEPESYANRKRRKGAEGDLDDQRKVTLLTQENEQLHGKVGRLEERIAVLERIATDPAERTARAIDALRD